jgi:hypothetical protein
MSATPEAFGSWHTASDGTAHYVLMGKCLCGAKVKATDPPPERAAKSLALVTPLCTEFLDLNAARWRGKKSAQSGAPLRPQRTFWWRQPRRKKR